MPGMDGPDVVGRRSVLEREAVQPMPSALEEVAASAEQVARDQQLVALKARTMLAQRARGWSWARILDDEDSPGLFELLRRSRVRLTAIVGRVGRGLAAGLAAEGYSRRQIASRLGITHQRVSTLLADQSSGPDR